MKTTLGRLIPCAGAGMVAALLAGCGSTHPPRFYALQPMPEAVTAADRDSRETGLLLGVGPIMLPKYLERPQIAVFTGGPEIYYSDLNRWAAPVEENIGNVVSQNLGALLATCRIVRFPVGKDLQFTYWVVIQVTRFDGEPGGRAALDAQWLVYTPANKLPLKVRSVLLEQPVLERNYASLVRSQSALLGELSRRIADDIRALEKDKVPPAGTPSITAK